MAREPQRKRAGAAGEIKGAVIRTGRNEMREALGFAGAVGNGKTSEHFRGAREAVANQIALVLVVKCGHRQIRSQLGRSPAVETRIHRAR